jgi:hypothetical protein
VNTSTVYVEPIFVGCLVGLALALPFAADLKDFYDYLPGNLPISGLPGNLHISGTFLGVLAIGAAYIIGIPADRLLDTLMEGLAGHCRIRFMLKDETNWARIVAGEKPLIAGQDLFPEDRYRTEALLHASPAFNDWLQYIRTRVRITRALAFTIPSMTFAGLACFVLNTKPLAPTSCTEIWLLKGGVPIAWISAMFFALLLERHASKHSSERDKVPSRMSIWQPRGRWNPPHTKKTDEVRNYVHDRIGKHAKNSSLSPPAKISLGGLFLDVGLQPFPVSAALLLVVAAIAGHYSRLGALALIPTGFGALLTCAVGYAWWRSTETFMRYVLIAGREIERSASKAAR